MVQKTALKSKKFPFCDKNGMYDYESSLAFMTFVRHVKSIIDTAVPLVPQVMLYQNFKTMQNISENDVNERVKKIAQTTMSPETMKDFMRYDIFVCNSSEPLIKFINCMKSIFRYYVDATYYPYEPSSEWISYDEYNKLPKRLRRLFNTSKHDGRAYMEIPLSKARIQFKSKKDYEVKSRIIRKLHYAMDKLVNHSIQELRESNEKLSLIYQVQGLLLQLGTFATIIPPVDKLHHERQEYEQLKASYNIVLKNKQFYSGQIESCNQNIQELRQYMIDKTRTALAKGRTY